MLKIRDMLLTRDVFPTKEWEQEYEFLIRKRDRYSDKIVRDDLDWLTFKKKAITSKLKYKENQNRLKREREESLKKY